MVQNDSQDRAGSGNSNTTKDLLKNFALTKKAIVAGKPAKTKPGKDTQRKAADVTGTIRVLVRSGVGFGCVKGLVPVEGRLR